MNLDVWMVDLASVRPCRARGCLSGDERARAARMTNPRVRAEFVAAREALRHILGSACETSPGEVTLAVTARGKPLLAGSSLRFNLSHSGGRALVATTTAYDIGVDIEQVRPDPEERGVRKRWVRREAVAKASGEGLSVLRAVRVSRRADGHRRAVLRGRPPGTWCVVDVAVGEGWVAAVAVPGDEPPVLRRRVYLPASNRVARSA